MPTNQPQNPLIDPFADRSVYPDGNPNDWRRLVSWVPASIWNDIYIVCPIKGTQQAIINTLINKLHDELKARNITDFTDQQRLIEFIGKCRFTDEPAVQRSAVAVAAEQPGNASTVRRPASRTSATNPPTPNSPAVLRRDVKKRKQPARGDETSSED